MGKPWYEEAFKFYAYLWIRVRHDPPLVGAKRSRSPSGSQGLYLQNTEVAIWRDSCPIISGNNNLRQRRRREKTGCLGRRRLFHLHPVHVYLNNLNLYSLFYDLIPGPCVQLLVSDHHEAAGSKHRKCPALHS